LLLVCPNERLFADQFNCYHPANLCYSLRIARQKHRHCVVLANTILGNHANRLHPSCDPLHQNQCRALTTRNVGLLNSLDNLHRDVNLLNSHDNLRREVNKHRSTTHNLHGGVHVP
jgi:hypothetical protein